MRAYIFAPELKRVICHNSNSNYNDSAKLGVIVINIVIKVKKKFNGLLNLDVKQENVMFGVNIKLSIDDVIVTT